MEAAAPAEARFSTAPAGEEATDELDVLLGFEGREQFALVLDRVEPLLQRAERDAEVEAHP